MTANAERDRADSCIKYYSSCRDLNVMDIVLILLDMRADLQVMNRYLLLVRLPLIDAFIAHKVKDINKKLTKIT